MSIGSPKPHHTAEFSTGDYQWVVWLPLDSKASIESAFEVLAKDHHTDRIWWRGGQEDLWFKNTHFRSGNRLYAKLWEWLKFLARDVGTNRIAIEAARKNNMEIWLWTGLLEFGSSADVGACSTFLYEQEAKIRIEHPEWIPVNKYGTRRQSGTIEFAYPQARKIVIDQLVELCLQSGYQGIVFYTFVENFAFRYMDEFGYNEPIVQEFKKRHGVDIRTQPFDKQAWSKLRGEYVTQFLRELHSALKPHGIKVAVRLNNRDGQSHLPEIWGWAAESKETVVTAGNLYMDWRRWVKEGIVDELNVYHPGNAQTLKLVMDEVRGTNVKVSTFSDGPEQLPPGVTWVESGSINLESGFPGSKFHGIEGKWYEKVPMEIEPLSSLESVDVYARRRVLYLIAQNKHPDTVDVYDRVARAALEDRDLYVRRQALDALVTLNDPRGVTVLEAALNDPEHSARCKAAVNLGKMKSASSIGLIFDAIRHNGTFQFNYMAAAGTIAELAPSNPQAVLDRTTDPHPDVRRVAVQCLSKILGPASRDALLRAAVSDEQMYVREMALASLLAYPSDDRIIAAMYKAMADGDEILQAQAANCLSRAMPRDRTNLPKDASPYHPSPRPFELYPAGSDEGKVQRQALVRLLEFFHQYGRDCKRSDVEWGWRLVGNAILCFGDEGQAALKEIIERSPDQTLATNAWKIVYERFMSSMEFSFTTVEQDEQAHRHHPALRHRENKPPAGINQR